MSDWKAEELFRMFSNRTRRKDKENYIVNSIWQRINDLDVEPVTQQCIRFDGGKHALIDLYFPQVNVAIECDEEYHKDNELLDLERALKIEDILSSVKFDEEYKLFRINAQENIEKIHEKVDEIVQEIRTRIDQQKAKGCFCKWKSVDEKIKDVQNRGMLAVRDMIPFRTIELACTLFKISPPSQCCFFKANEDYQLWFPKLAIDDGVELKYQSEAGWMNILSDDWSTITEYNEVHPEKVKVKKGGLKDRIVFAKGKDKYGHNAYRFIGVFMSNQNNYNLEKRIYTKIDDKLDLNKF